jgi:hypothetical protein
LVASKLPLAEYEPCKLALGGGVARPLEKPSNMLPMLLLPGTAVSVLPSQADEKVSFMAAVRCWLTLGVGLITASL